MTYLCVFMIRRKRDLRSSWEWRCRLWYCGCHNSGGHKVYMTYERYPSDWHSFILLSQRTIINLQKCYVWCYCNIRSTKQLSIAHRCARKITDTRPSSHCCRRNDNGSTEIECCGQEWMNERTRKNLSCCVFIAGTDFKLKRSKYNICFHNNCLLGGDILQSEEPVASIFNSRFIRIVVVHTPLSTVATSHIQQYS